MPNIPSKPSVALQEWIDEQTPLDHDNLTNGVNQNITNLKTAVDGLIDALGGENTAPPLKKYSSGSSAWDTTPTKNSTKPCTSGGIYSALGPKLYRHNLTIVTQDNSATVLLYIVTTYGRQYSEVTYINDSSYYVSLAGGQGYITEGGSTVSGDLIYFSADRTAPGYISFAIVDSSGGVHYKAASNATVSRDNVTELNTIS